MCEARQDEELNHSGPEIEALLLIKLHTSGGRR